EFSDVRKTSRTSIRELNPQQQMKSKQTMMKTIHPDLNSNELRSEKMKTHLRLFVVSGLTKLPLHLVLMATIAAIAFPSLISAAPVEASGTWDDCNFAPVFRAAGPNTVETVGITENFFGTLSGTYAGTDSH